MVSAGISFNGKTRIHFCAPGVKINSVYYTEYLLGDCLLPDCKQLYPNGDFIFQQDGAPAHTSKLTIKYLHDRNIVIINPKEWPPCSPDCNPMDYRIWALLEQTVYGGNKIDTVEMLKQKITDAWNSLSMDAVRSAIGEFVPRVQAVIRNAGGQIEHQMGKR